MKRTISIIVSLLLLTGLGAFLIISNLPGFTGERVKNPDSYALDIQQMNGSDRHAMELTAGDVLKVEFKTEKGTLHMALTSPSGTLLYDGNGEAATDFEINIPETGVYTVAIEARHAKGILHMYLKEVAA